MGTATGSKVSSAELGDGEAIVSNVTLSNSYSQGGDTITADALGFRVGARLDSVLADPTEGRAVQYVPDPVVPGKGKLKVQNPDPDDFLLNRANLAIGTVDPAEVAHGTFTKSVAGALAEVTGAEVAFTATTHDIAPDANTPQEAIYLLSVNAAGAVAITKGATADQGSAVPPAAPAAQAVMGYVRIVVAAGATPFDATTDDLDAAHLTTTFEDWDGEELEGTDLSGLTVRVTAHGR